jgi:hypothetical protein
LDKGLITLHCKKRAYHEMLHRILDLDGFFGIARMMKSRRMRLSLHVACMGEIRNACKILVRKSEGKRPL